MGSASSRMRLSRTFGSDQGDGDGALEGVAMSVKTRVVP